MSAPQLPALPQLDLSSLGTELMRVAGLSLTGLGIFVAVWALVADETGPAHRYWARYTSMLERKLRPMFIFTKGGTIALGQLGALFALAAAHMLIGIPYVEVVVIAVLVAPVVYIDKLRKERIEAIDKQLDSFLLSLANALKTTPSVGAAFQSITNIVLEPTRSELELAIKEIKVGSTLDQALLHMASRVGSKQMDAALSAVLIGRQVGGNLPKVLETTAYTLREMARLEGVVRTKTAEAKMQLWVLGGLPIVLFFALNYMWVGYFLPLTTSVTGYIVLFACGAMWVSALVLARKVLSVDI